MPAPKPMTIGSGNKTSHTRIGAQAISVLASERTRPISLPSRVTTASPIMRVATPPGTAMEDTMLKNRASKLADRRH